ASGGLMKKLLVVLLLTFSGLLSLPVQALDFSAHGYYRLRLEVSSNLDLQSHANIQQGTQGDNDRFGTLFFGQPRFRLEPALKWNANIPFQAQIDFLENVILGRNHTRQLKTFSPVVGTLELPDGNGA